MEALIILIIVGGIILIYAAMRKGSSAVKTKPSKILSFIAETQQNDALKIVIKFAQQSGYKIDDIDEINGRVILSDSFTAISMGFFYPVYISKKNEGKTLVEVGIKSKAFQVGPIETRNLEKCYNGIKAAIFANT